MGGPIVNGESKNASVAGISGPVVSYYYGFGDHAESVITTMNYTLPGHVFYNGWVRRDWFRGADGAVWVATTGSGTNASSTIAGLIQFSGSYIFDFIDSSAVAFATKNICRRGQ